MFRSILNSGQEEVPARVWDGVSSGLDKLAHRKMVALWWRRTSICVASAAAVAACIWLLITPPAQTPEVLTAEVLPADVQADDALAIEQFVHDTEAEEISVVKKSHQKESQSPYIAFAPEAAEVIIQKEESIEVLTEEVEAEKTGTVDNSECPMTMTDDWPQEDKLERKKRSISLTVSGTTGGGAGQKQVKPGILKKPSMSSTPPSTGITEANSKNIFGLPVSFGIGAKIDLTKKWSLGVGVNYTLLHRKFMGTFTKVEDGIVVEKTTSDIRNLQHYVGIPLNVYYNIINKNKINFYAYGGGAVEKCVANEYKILKSSSLHKEKVQGVQWSANLGIGVEFMLGKHLGLYIDPSARYYFANRQPTSVRTSQPLLLGCELGFRTRF